MEPTDNKYHNTLFHDLTHRLIGFSFDIFKQIGPRLPERIYQQAFENKLTDAGIPFSRECYCKIVVDDKRVGSFRLDFLVENKIIVELKVRSSLLNKDIAQVLTYMRTNNIKLGLILLHTPNRVEVKRLIL